MSRSDSHYNKITPLIVACALFMEHLDASIIATALPTIAGDLHINPLHLNLAITAYMLSLAVFIPVSGWAADRYGGRTIFKAAIVVFMAGSLLCGLSENLPMLVASRIIQGMGGAMMVPVGRLILLRSIPKSHFVEAMALVGAPAMVGPVVGPPLGGLIVTYFSWQWIFFVNIPIGLLGLYFAHKHIPAIKGRSRDKLDMAGFCLIACSMVGLFTGFEMIGRGVVDTATLVALIAIGAGCFSLYVVRAKKMENPIIDFKVMQTKTYRVSVIGGILFRLGVGAAPFLLPLLFQVGFNKSPLLSGGLVLATAAGAVTMKFIAKPVLHQFGYRPTLVVCSILNALFLASYALFNPATPDWVIFVVILLGGFVASLQFTALNTIAFADMPDALMSRANTIYNMIQQLSMSLGVAVGALLLHGSQSLRGAGVLTEQDFMPAFLVISFLVFASTASFLSLDKKAGSSLIHK